jgi:hypothetical protein
MEPRFEKNHSDRTSGAGWRTMLPRGRLSPIAKASLTALVVLACSKSPQIGAGNADSLKRDLELAPVAADQPLNDAPKSPAPSAPEMPAPRAKEKAQAPVRHSPRPTPSAAPRAANEAAPVAPASAAAPLPVAELTLPIGTAIQAALQDSISSRRNKVGDVVEARVARDITDPAGRVVIPAGARVPLTIAELAPAKGKGAADGKLAFQATSVTVNGQTYSLTAQVQPVHHELRGRGISAGEAEKVGAGTAIGAIAGRIIGGNATGAVVGGVVGAAGGTAVAVETASRDVVVGAGTTVDLTLTAPLVVKAR